MSWRHLDGPELTVQVTNGGVAVSAKDVMQYSSDTVIAATDGCEAAGVMHEDGAIDETGLKMDLLVPGSIWEVTVSSQTFNRGAKVYMAGASNVDAGAQGNIAVGVIVNKAIADTATVAQVLITGDRFAHA